MKRASDVLNNVLSVLLSSSELSLLSLSLLSCSLRRPAHCAKA